VPSSRTSLTRGGKKHARAALIALCRRGLKGAAFGQELRARLRRLVDFDAYCLNACDTASGVVTSSVGDGLESEQARALFALEARAVDRHCLRDLFAGPVRVGALWLATSGHPEQSLRMREIFIPLGFGDELRAALLVGQTCYGYLHLFRSAQRPPFSALDLAEVSRVSPHLARGLRAAHAPRARGPAPPLPARVDPGPALLLLDAADAVLEKSADAEALLAARDTLRVDSGLPHVVRDVASRARRGEAARATFGTESRAPLSVSAVQLGQQTAIVIDEPSAHELDELGLSAFDLTQRERAVSRRIAAGESNQRIALTLGISLYTVKDHVRAVLLKTGCATRSEFAARLQRRSAR